MSRYTIESSECFTVFDTQSELYCAIVCECETEAKAEMIIEALMTLEELNKGNTQ